MENCIVHVTLYNLLLTLYHLYIFILRNKKLERAGKRIYSDNNILWNSMYQQYIFTWV